MYLESLSSTAISAWYKSCQTNDNSLSKWDRSAYSYMAVSKEVKQVQKTQLLARTAELSASGLQSFNIFSYTA